MKLTRESNRFRSKTLGKIFSQLALMLAVSNHPKKLNGCVLKQKNGLTGSFENRFFFRYSGRKATTFLCPLALKNSTTILMPFTEKTFMWRPWLMATLLPSMTTGRNPDRGCELLPTEKKREIKKTRNS